MTKKIIPKIAGFLILAPCILTSCSTSSFMGLSKASYVDNEIQRLSRTADEIELLKSTMKELEGLSGDVDALKEEVDQVIAIEEELLAMVETFRNRLDELPEETLRELIQAIEAHLSKTAVSNIEVENPLLTDDVPSPLGDG